MRLLRDQRGQALIITTVAFTAALLIMAVVLDMDRAWLVRAKLQTAVDAATLAGVQKAQVLMQKEKVPVRAQDFVADESQLPDPASIIAKSERYGSDGEFLGWDVTWIKAYKERVVRVWLDLPLADAQAEANNVVAANETHWLDEEPMAGVRIYLDNQGVRVSDDRTVSYWMKAHAEMDSLLLGPLLGKPVITIDLPEQDSTARLGSP
ncbi:MAG: pilus assembly protein TadG-related protein [Bacillota bacterium]